MSLDKIPSDQLEALKLLLTDTNLRNILMSPSSSHATQHDLLEKSARPAHCGSSRPVSASTSSKIPSIPDIGSPPYEPRSSNKSSLKARRGNHSAARSRRQRQVNGGSVKPKARLDPMLRSRSQKETVSAKRKEYASDIFMEDAEIVSTPRRRRFIIGIDYGTTFTSVSYYAVDMAAEDDQTLFPHSIGVIKNWPYTTRLNLQVPTESWYSSVPQARESANGQFENVDENSDTENAPESQAELHADMSQPDLESNLDHEASLRFLWGHEVPYQRYREYSTRNPNRHIERAKLMLVDSQHTAEDRQRLRPQLDQLIAKGIVRKFAHRRDPDARDVQDLITDFMVPVLQHTRSELVKFEDYNDATCSVSFALTVPTIWSARSSRILQYALENAIKITGFGSLGHGSVDNLFVASEPEAAATYLLGNSRNMLPGETFTVMDCGGGTVDGSTYTVTSSYPLRLDEEVVLPTGDNCGASYLNENYEALLMRRLADEDYLESNESTIESIVKNLLLHFEEFDKRTKDTSNYPAARVPIRGLLGDTRRNLIGNNAKRFDDNILKLNSEDYNEVFEPLLQRTRAVLRKQFDAARDKGKIVKKVFLIGGFGAAPSLRSDLKKFLLEYVVENNIPSPIELVLSDEETCVTACSSGAVLRALNVQNGPLREAHSNYGFLRIQPFEPEHVRGHREAEAVIDKFDGNPYVTVIDYFMLKGKVIDPVHTFDPLQCTHTFPVDTEKLNCVELIYVNDDDTKSNYALVHPRNRGAQIAGKIVTDMTFLLKEHKLVPKKSATKRGKSKKSKFHYEVQYDLVVTVEGRNLRFEARYPSGSSGKTLETGQISIAAAFKPGTA